ncbi:H-type lectin domain-containing protein [Streptomyces yaizuensis]|uniref:H-type lectin domain-containing protein n=1 Tax=Streptomyces yaizuensis TaxID=2989713 RepID=A0ABQ5P4M2_9ACTN|nr:H-type lectin domain-containing protein [Streptomyces sp. YSPA8]GLF97541.1 H-type lectin domain-containing protein [Streptomyces sp. YSPA8]
MTVRVGRLTSGMTPEDHRLAASTAMAPSGPLTTVGGCLPGGLDLAPVPGSALQATLSAGRLWIQGTSAAAQGGYAVTVDAPALLTFGAGHATNARIDSVVVRVKDPAHDGSTGTPTGEVLVVEGTPSGIPTPPVIPANSERLYDVTVAKVGVGLDWSTGVADRRRYTAAVGGIVPPGSGVAFDGGYNGQYRDANGVLERWNGTAWEPILRLGNSGQLQLGDVRFYRETGPIAATNAIFRTYRQPGENAFSSRVPGETYSRIMIGGDGTINWGGGTSLDTFLHRSAANTLRTSGDLVVRSHKAHYGESGTALVTFTNSTTFTVAVTFATPFASVPRVYTNLDSSHTAANNWWTRAHTITTTGFRLHGFNKGDLWSWSNMPVSWSAFA